MHTALRLQTFLIVAFLSVAMRVNAADVWDSPAFSTDPAVLRQAAQAIKAGHGSKATVLLNDLLFKVDEDGKTLETRHLIYRIENQDGVTHEALIGGQPANRAHATFLTIFSVPPPDTTSDSRGFRIIWCAD
jgi:hypothetical protein